MKRSEFERNFGREAAAVAIDAGAKFEPEEPEPLRLTWAETIYGGSRKMHWLMMRSGSLEYPSEERPLTSAEAASACAWYNARAEIEAAARGCGLALPKKGTPFDRFWSATLHALAASKVP